MSIDDIPLDPAGRLRQAIQAHPDHPSAATIARATGIAESTMRSYINGNRNPPLDACLHIGAFLGVNGHWLFNGSGMSLDDARQRSQQKPEPEFFDKAKESLMPVYASAAGSSDGLGAMIMDTDPIEYRERPDVLRHVKKAFAVVVTGESMVPAFKPHDRAWVNPQRRPEGGDDCLLYFKDRRTGEERFMIKEFIRETPAGWYVRQHNPDKEWEVSKADWPLVFFVAGKFARGA